MSKTNNLFWGVLLFFIPFLLSGQKDIDSLHHELKINPSNVVVLNDLAEALLDKSPVEADSLATIALRISREAKNMNEEARALVTLINAAWERQNFNKALLYAEMAGEVYLSTGNQLEAGRSLNDAALAAYEIDKYDAALRKYKRTLSILLEIDDQENIPTVLVNLGQVYERIGCSDSAIYFYQQAIGLCQGPGREIELSAAYGNLGLVYKNLGNFNLALENYTRARDISILIEDSESLATDLNNIASVYVHWENYKMAREYFRQALEIHQKNAAPDKAEVTMGNLALLYQKEGKYDSALSLYKETYLIAQKLGRVGSMAIKLNNIGTIYHELGEYDSAIVYQTEALKISRKLQRMFTVCSSLQNLGDSYLAKNDLSTALEYLDEALDCSEQIKSKPILEKVYKSRSELFEKMGLAQMALEMHRKYTDIKYSLFTVQSQEKLAEMEAIYQNEKKQHEIEILLKDKALNESRINRSRIILYWLASGLAMFILASVVVTWLLLQKSKANRKLVEKNLELMKQEDCDDLSLPARIHTEINEEEKIRLVSELESLIRKEKIFTIRQLTLNDLAARLNTNTSYLSGIINNDFGRPFKDFINQYRIKEAQKMFADGWHKTMTIEAIAETVGFQSRSTFHTSFKKFTGVTATVYIKNIEKIASVAA